MCLFALRMAIVLLEKSAPCGFVATGYYKDRNKDFYECSRKGVVMLRDNTRVVCRPDAHPVIPS
ncbi:MAG: hypothetical protein KF852_03750 [Saprospiraceae bacterium]|nr:hypothetical protein [Saprospiraceae bacterium]